MPHRSRHAFAIMSVLLAAAGGLAIERYGPRSLLSAIGVAAAEGRADAAARRVTPRLQRELAAAKLPWGAPLLIRIFKLESALELWVDDGQQYRLFRSYPICTFSGGLGPKLRQGDRQAPEGFYEVRPDQMNPASTYHLSFDLGYPNGYDAQNSRTGDHLMVHGSCVSIGCYAMGDDAIEEIYTLMSTSFAAGTRAIPVHAFPFRFDRDDVEMRLTSARWGEFWRELRDGWSAFEATRRAPEIAAIHGHYRVLAPAP